MHDDIEASIQFLSDVDIEMAILQGFVVNEKRLSQKAEQLDELKRIVEQREVDGKTKGDIIESATERKLL